MRFSEFSILVFMITIVLGCRHDAEGEVACKDCHVAHSMRTGGFNESSALAICLYKKYVHMYFDKRNEEGEAAFREIFDRLMNIYLRSDDMGRVNFCRMLLSDGSEVIDWPELAIYISLDSRGLLNEAVCEILYDRLSSALKQRRIVDDDKHSLFEKMARTLLDRCEEYKSSKN